MGYTSKEKDFGINYRFTNLTTLASAGNPGGYPTGPFKIYSWDAINNIWHLEYNNTNTYPILHLHEFDFISSKIKIECTNSFVFVPANGDFNIYNV